jgi:putative peptidoglycan lipid II flippase
MTEAASELSRGGLVGDGDMDRPDAGGLVRAGLLVTGLYLASRILGWVRLSVLAAVFGTGRDLDAFYAAFRLPDLMFQLVAAGALSAALIPMITSLVAGGEAQRAWRATSTVTSVMLVALVVLSLAFELAAPLVVPLITPGFNTAELDQTVTLTRIMLVSPILLALGTAATSVLNAQGRFGAAALAPIVYNLGIIGGALLLSAPLGVVGLALGVVAGSIAHFAIQVRPMLRVGFRFSPAIDLGDPVARRTLALLAPRAFGLGATQLVFVVVTSIASTLGPGAITVLNFAWTLLSIPVGVLGIPVGAVAFPSLARDHATGSTDMFVSLLTRASRLVLFVMAPVSALGIVLSREVVTILFEYGRFQPGAGDAIASTLSFFMLGLVAHALLPVLTRAFYARHDTVTPVAGALLTVVVNSAVAIVLGGPFGLEGIALSFGAAAWLEAIFLLVVLQRRLPTLDLIALGRLALETLACSAAAALAAVAAVGLLEHATDGGPGKVAALGVAIVAAAVFSVVYLGLAKLLRIPELPGLFHALRAGLARRAP